MKAFHIKKPFRLLSIVVIMLGLNLAGCDKSENSQPKPVEPSQPEKGTTAMNFTITSPAFASGASIPVKYTGDGDDVSPPLSFANLPAGTRELALICDDPDAPTPQPWVHWVIYKVPAEATDLPEAIKTTAQLGQPSGALQGPNSWPTTGYRGPAPPSGVHHYHFKLYALDTKLNLAPGLDKTALLAAMKGHILAETELIGTYQR